VRARSGLDGRVGVTWQTSQGEIKFAQSSKLGWQTSTAASAQQAGAATAPDFDYLSGNRPVVAYSASNTIRVAAYDGLTWKHRNRGYTQRPVGRLCERGRGQPGPIGLAFRNSSTLVFAIKDTASGTWASMNVGNYSTISHLSLDLVPVTRPALPWYRAGAVVASFDIQTGTWMADLLSTSLSSAA